MGGKSKQARVKNNAKPSNSSRSAELLGSTASTFVGFSAHSDHGLIPFAPGFNDNMTDSLDQVTLDPQLQLILRKMSKKDPVTKVKALQEFTDLLDSYDVETVKNLLPIWPKLYQNLATDVDHRVREGSQEVMQKFTSKCKKAVAPYLKQLVPVWLASTFDNYAPAASIANASLKETFIDKISDVCMHCRAEIVEYTGKNLTFHTASTLTLSKSCTPEEAEQKYQRVVCCSLKTLSFFMQKTNNSDISSVHQVMKDILGNAKFWSFSKSKVTSIKASWFELLYHLLQTEGLKMILNVSKTQIISVCFQNLDESEPLIAPHVWGCILLVQSTYDDWYDVVNLKKVILPKLSSLLRNGCNKNTNAICPNLLPFLSKITQESLKETNINDFQKQFFDDIFIALTTLDNKSKSDYSAITSAYFECLRYVIQRINVNMQSENSADQVEVLKVVAKRLLNENIIDLLTLCLTSDGFVVKYIIQHSSLLIAFWADPAKNSKLYSELLEIFWTDSIAFITEKLEKEKDDEIFLNNITDLIEKLYSVNSKIEDQRVKFALEVDEFTTELDDYDDDDENHGFSINPKVNTTTNRETRGYSKNKSNKMQLDPLTKKSNTALYIERELKSLVLQLVRLCLTKCTEELSSKYILKVHQLTNLFCDADFYQRISEENSIPATLNMLLKALYYLDDEACDRGIEIIFNALNFLEKERKFDFIITNLLKNNKTSIQLATLNRLLSHPLNVEPEVRLMLSQQEAHDLVVSVATAAIYENSKNSLNLLRKCFFQTDSGDIPIGSKAVESILDIVSRPLKTENEMEHLMDSCGSFIAQIMPVICSGENSSQQLQREIFLKLFEFSIEHSPDDFISEDTLWEISTCWQDALSSKDIVLDAILLQSCKTVVENCLQKESLTFELVDTIAGAITQFVICSTEHITDEKNCFQQINNIINEFLRHNECTLTHLNKTQELCLFLEGLQGKVTVDEELHSDCMKLTENVQAYHQTLLNSCILYKLICKPGIRQLHSSSENLDSENINHCADIASKSESKQWSETLYNETLRCIGMASVGDALIDFNFQIKPSLETIFIQLSEKVKMLLRESEEDFIINIKELMWNRASEKTDITACRSLLYILFTEQYEQFEENATIFLLEELSDYFLSKNSFRSYVKTLQYLLPKLTPKAITTEISIMKTSQNKIWVKAAILRCLVQNNFNVDYNEKSDYTIIAQTLQFLSEVSEKQHSCRELLLYNVEIHNQSVEKIIDTVELIHMLLEIIKLAPYELSIKNWDTIRIGLSSWVLSVSKSIEHVEIPHVSLFITKVFQLYAGLQNFILNEKQKSSTELLKNIIDEWDNLFARDVNLVLFKSYYKLVDTKELADSISTCYDVILENITPAIELLDYGVIFNFYKSSTKITIENIMNFLLKNLSNKVHCIRTSCAHILKKFTQYFVALDIELYENKSESTNLNAVSGDWHFLSRFEDYIGRYEVIIRKYLDEFSFKLTELAEMKPIDRNEALSYLLLWDCIVYVCSNSPLTLRSLYTNWLHEKHYEENLLHFLFRAMPTEILKTHDSKLMTTDVFKGLTWNQIKDKNLVVEKYACHMYTEVLRRLPAVVRKWWNSCPSRQKTFIDKLTTNFVSPIICSEELRGIANKKEKHENMLVTVHTSTREVLAVYSIDEARMELVITLAVNYPLGSVKVESGKQIGGRLSSRNIGMQLTIFLTHQNGSIFDGLTLWKNNLDKKFEGVEECYVCYTVIHQDTCQLPKLTCKTCKKKFHGPCLYKWFTTSSKSTCPICRNVF